MYGPIVRHGIQWDDSEGELTNDSLTKGKAKEVLMLFNLDREGKGEEGDGALYSGSWTRSLRWFRISHMHKRLKVCVPCMGSFSFSAPHCHVWTGSLDTEIHVATLAPLFCTFQ